MAIKQKLINKNVLKIELHFFYTQKGKNWFVNFRKVKTPQKQCFLLFSSHFFNENCI